jgi:acetyl esterase/lipase
MLRPILAALLLAAAFPLAAQTNAARVVSTPVEQGGIFIQRDIVFGKGGDRDLHADLAWPKYAPKPMSAIIHIHGGGWVGGNQRWDAGLAHFAQHGYFVASIEYRLDGTAKWPAQIQDCKCAVRWLRANALKYGVDPNRIGVIGESAGGHLAALVGVMSHVTGFEGDGGWPGVSSAVQCAVDYYGRMDLTQQGIFSAKAQEYNLGLLGVPYAQNPALWLSASPLHYVSPECPPILIVQGDADQLAPVQQSRAFAAALTKAGVPNRLIVVKNGKHGFVPLPGTTIAPSLKEIDQATLDFFNKNLGAAR